MEQQPYFKEIDKESLKNKQEYFESIKEKLLNLKKDLVDTAIKEIQKKCENLNNGNN